MLSKSLVQFSVYGWSCVPSLLFVCVCVKLLSRVQPFATPWTVAHQPALSMGFSSQKYWSGLPVPSPGDLPDPGMEPRSPTLRADALTSESRGMPGANGDGGNEDNNNLLENIACMYCYTHCPQPCSRPPPTHASTGDSWTLPGKSGAVSRGATAPFSWTLGNTRFCLCLQESISQSCVGSGSSVVGLMVTSSKRVYDTPRSDAHRAPGPAAVHCCPIQEKQTAPYSLSQSLWGPWVLVPECLWQECLLILNANSPLLPSCWGFSFALEHGVSPHSFSRATWPLLQRLPSCWGSSDLGRGVSPSRPLQRHTDVCSNSYVSNSSSVEYNICIL